MTDRDDEPTPVDASRLPWSDPEHDDRALARLEDVLAALPFDRALPELAVVLERAACGDDLLRRDDRARKVLHEAIVARPFGALDEVTRTRTEVELLTLEVEILTDRLVDAGSDATTVRRSLDRLAHVQSRLDEIAQRL